jgi:hypothetical protein
MGASIYISLDPNVASAGPDSMDGKALSRAIEKLDALLEKNRRPTLSSFISMDLDEMESLIGDDDDEGMAPLEAQWFDPVQGIAQVEFLLSGAAASEVSKLRGVAEDLQACLTVLQAAHAAGAKWRFVQDI